MVPEDVVDVGALGGKELVPLGVAHRLEEVVVLLVDHQRRLEAQLGEGLDRRLGLGRRGLPLVEDEQRLVGVALGDGRADGGAAQLLGHVVLVVAHLGRHGLAAADPLRGADGALAGAAGALLSIGLLAAAGDQRAVLHAHRVGAPRGELRLDHLVEERVRVVERRVDEGVGEVDGADLLLLDVEDVQGRHVVT